MVEKMNCWEVMQCGREPGGSKSSELGICPACLDEDADGLNGGRNGGRICWAVAGTFCGGIVQGTFAKKEIICMACKFFKRVKEEEGLANFSFLKPGQKYRKSIRT